MSLADEPSHLGVAARVAEAYAPSDERRSAYLDLLVKRGGTCRGCGAGVGDALLEVHPGVCATCFRLRHLRPDPALLAELEARRDPLPAPPAPPAVKTFRPAPRVEAEKRAEPPPAPRPAQPAAPQEVPMPCSNCGSKSHNRRTCDQPAKLERRQPAKAPALPPAPKLVRKPRTVRVDDADELLERRKELLSELERVDEQISLCLAAKEDELARIKAAVQAATKRAAEAARP